MKLYTSLLLSLLLVTNIWAQPDPATLDAFVESAVEKFDLPSLSIAVVQNGQIVLQKGYGQIGDDAGNTPDQNTLYAIASLSKAFTVASIGMLVDEEKLAWDDKVVDHLPWFKMHDPYVTQHMTIEDLLCHRSGLITFDGDLLWYGSTYEREEAIKRVQHREPTHEFRDKFGYQNLMFMTAGEVIESVSGMTWDDFVSTRILKPLGMNRTTSSFTAFSTDFNNAKPHLKNEEIFMLSYDNSGATAALNSTTGDMAKWIMFWLNKGVINGDTLLSETAINKIWSMHTPLAVGSFDEQNGTRFKGYGLGWFMLDYNCKKVIHHGGGLPGYISKLTLFPEDELGLIVLTNDMSSVPTMLMYAASDWVNGKDHSKWIDTFYKFKEQNEAQERAQISQRLKSKEVDPVIYPVEDYLGTYSDEMYGEAVVSLGKDGLILSLLPAKELFTGTLNPWSKHAFQFNHNDPFLTYGIVKFDVDKDVIKGFRIDLPNYDFHFDKLYFKRD